MRYPLSNYFLLLYMNKKITSKSNSKVDQFACESCEDETSLEMALGGSEGNSNTLSPVVNCRPQQARMSLVFSDEKNLILLPSKRKKVFLLAQQQLQPIRRHYYSAKRKLPLLISSNGLLVKATPFQPSLFLYASKVFSFVLQICLSFATVCMSLIAIPVLFLNKPILLVN